MNNIYRLKNTHFKRFFSNYLILLISFLILILFLTSSEFAKTGALSGLKLWLFTVLPALFPFIFITEIIKGIGGIPFLSKLVHPFVSQTIKLSFFGTYPLVLGLLCGFPMGAKAVSDMLSENKISKKEGEFLLTFANMLSPGFIAGYYCQGILGGEFNTAIVLVIIYLSQLITCVVFKVTVYKGMDFNSLLPSDVVHHHKKTYINNNDNKSCSHGYSGTDNNNKAPSISLDKILSNTFNSVYKIAGYIIIFSVLCEYIKVLPLNPYIDIIITSITEVTTGTNKLSDAPFSLNHKFIIGNAAMSFGGLSGIFQTLAMVKEHSVEIKTYVISRIFSAIITGSLSYIYLFVIK